jgi:putative ABC transport system permease protein
MLGLALKMLFGDTAKYLMLVAGLFVATFLMAQQTAVFCGLMLWTTSTLKNVPAPIWVVESKVAQINETNPMRDTDVALVRSVDSVAWAMPIFAGIQRVRMPDGSFKVINLIGVDATSLAGAPPKLIAGNIDDLRLPNTVIIDDLAIERLSKNPKDKKAGIKVGDSFEINDIEARVVGIAKAMRSFTGGPYIWTTYERALQYSPPSRKMLSAVIAAPKLGVSREKAIEEIERVTGLKAYSNGEFTFNSEVGKHEFNTSTIWWYVKNTGIPISFGITVIVGLLTGIAIASQTFYSFVLENMKHLGALKAMGASNLTLCSMLILQSFTVGLIGFGIGLFATAGFARGALANQQPPFFMTWHVPVVVFIVITGICSFAALLGIWRVSRYEPAMVFRG